MFDYRKRQNEEFRKLREILKNKEETQTIQTCIEQLEVMFFFYTVEELDWKDILQKVQQLSGTELENFLLWLVTVVKTRDEV